MDPANPPAFPGRRFSIKVFRYILVEYIVILMCCIGAFMTLFLIMSLFDDLEDFLAYKASFDQVIRYFILLQPGHLIHTLPISLLMSTMYVISGLSRHNELTALRASGISILHFSFPIWIVAVVMMGFYLFVGEYLAPTGRRLAEQLNEEIKEPIRKTIWRQKRYLAFRNKEENRDWFFENFDAEGTSKNVSITQFRPDRTVSWELFSREARFNHEGWTFSDVILRKFDDEGYFLRGKPEVAKSLRMPMITEDPGGFSFLFNLRPLEELSASKIYGILNEEKISLAPKTRSILNTYFYYYLFSPLSCIIAVFIGIPLAIVHERSGAVVNFIAAAGVLILYYLVTNFFIILGNSQVIPAFVAGASSGIVFTGYGIWQMKRSV